MVESSCKTLFPNFYFLPLQRWITTYLPHPFLFFKAMSLVLHFFIASFWKAQCPSQCLCCRKQNSNSELKQFCNIRNTEQVCRHRQNLTSVTEEGTASLATGNDSDLSFCLNCHGRSYHPTYPCRAQVPAFLFVPACFSDLVKLGGFDANPASLHTALPSQYFQRMSCAWL